MSIEDQIQEILQHCGLERLLAWNGIEERELVEMLVEDGILEIPQVHELEGFITDGKED